MAARDLHGAPREEAPDDGRALEDSALLGLEQVEARCDECLGRGGHRVEGAALLGVGDQLLGEERIPAGVVDDPCAHLVRYVCCERVGQRVHLLLVERAELDRTLGEPGAPFAELRSREAERQDRSFSVRAQLLDEVEQRRLGPVDVVEDEHERAFARAPFEEPPHGEQLLADRPGVSSRLFQALPGLGDHLSQGKERRPLPVRNAAAHEDGCFLADGSNELADDSGLAYPCFADDGDHAGAPRLAHALVCTTKFRQLPFTTDQRRIEGSSNRSCALLDPEHPESTFLRPHSHGMAAERERRRAEQDVAGCRLALEPFPSTHDIARHESVPGQDLAGVDADADFDAREFLPQPRRRSHGPQGIVFVRGRNAEDTEQLVAADCLNRAAVRVDRCTDGGERLRGEPAHLFGVEARSGRRDFARQDGDGLPPFLDGRKNDWQVERRILAEDRLLELAQRHARLEAEIVQERPACVLVGLEGVGLAAGAIERQHELPAQPLVERVVVDERLELADHVAVSAEFELRVDQVLPCREAKLFEALDLAGRERLIGQIAERRTAPERERPAQLKGALLGRIGLASRGNE